MMIFKRLLRPKWQHPDSSKRLESMSDLDSNHADFKGIMHELAFNDANEAVRLAALQRLNDFSLWWQASKHDSADKLKQFAERRVIEMVLANDIASALKQQFIDQCKRSHILEQIVVAEKDVSLKLSLLRRLNKPELIMHAACDPAMDAASKKQLIELIETDKELEQLSKSSDSVVTTLANELRQQRQWQREQPVKLTKQARLIMAKLNALKERNPTDSQQRFQQYQQEWQQLASQLHLLGDEAEPLHAKYRHIEQAVHAFFSDAWQRQQRDQELQLQREQQRSHAVGIELAIAALRIDVEQCLQQAEFQQAGALQPHLVALEAQLAQTEVSQADRLQLENQLAVIAQQFVDLPRIALCFAQAEQYLTQWAQQLLPTDLAQYHAIASQWQAWQQQWQKNLRGITLPLPGSIQQGFTSLQQSWQPVMHAFSQQQQRQFKLCRSKLAEFKRLHQAGKFKVLFGLFKGIHTDYQQLTDDDQKKLARLFQEAEQHVAELADWQDYIASPKKQALVHHMQCLAAEPLDHADQRAALVKQARADWQSLGKTKENDDALYRAFDDACEQAFAPCRLYFTEQQQHRERNAEEKKQCIAEMQQLALQHDVLAGRSQAFEREVQQLQQRWRAIGPVPKELHQSLQTDYQAINKTLKQLIKQQQQHFADQKQQLIAQATDALILEDANQTASILKQCQQQWKAIPFAGKAQDTLLWQQFRAVCDDFFAKRKEDHQQQRLDKEAQQQALKSELEQYGHAVAKAGSSDQLSPLRQQLQALDVQGFKHLQQTQEQLIAQIEQQQQSMLQQQETLSYQQLFHQLISAAPDIAAIPVASWREALSQPKKDRLDRQQLTLAIEMMAGVPPVTDDAVSLSQLKLQLLAEKHNQAKDVTPESLLIRWLRLGVVHASDRDLVARLAAVFIR